MRCYGQFASVYDNLIEQDYALWADYMQALFRRYGAQPQLVLDLGCGTGSLTVELAHRGYDMIGIDLSPDMLSVASAKGEGADIRWLCQDVSAFELYGTVDAVLCTLDVLNYLTKPHKLQKTFDLVKNYLNPNGLFLFDLNTPYKLQRVLGNHIFLHDTKELFYAWDNQFDEDTQLSTQTLTFFAREGAGYARFDEQHVQRAYPTEQVAHMLEKSGLTLLDTLHCLTMEQAGETTEKTLYVVKSLG